MPARMAIPATPGRRFHIDSRFVQPSMNGIPKPTWLARSRPPNPTIKYSTNSGTTLRISIQKPGYAVPNSVRA